MRLTLVRGSKLYLKQAFKFTRWLLGFGIVALMLYALYRNRADITQVFGKANWLWLFLAFSLNLVASLVYVGVWYYCSRLLGSTRGYRAALMSLSVAGAARYIPGGIWPIAGLVWFGPAAGLPRRLMPILAILAQGVHLLVAGLFGVIGLLLTLPLLLHNGFRPGLDYYLALLLLAGLGLFALIFGPRYLDPFLTYIIRLRSPQSSEASPIDLKIHLSNGVLLQPAWPSAIFWLLNGLRLWLIIMAFASLNLAWLPYLIWAGALTTLVSGLFFFVPLGLGVVEGSLALLLAALLSWPLVLGVLAANRLMRTLNDFVFLGLGLWLYRHIK